MFKVTPNPPDIDSVLYGDSLDPEKLKEAADRALKHYLNPGAPKTQIRPRKPSTIFTIDAAVDDETLLVEACESLASASVMVRVLDLMDEEHAAILSGSATDLTRDTNQPNSITDRPTAAEHSSCPGNDTFELQLHVAASNPDDLRKLLEIAVYELQRQIDAQGVVAAGERSTHPGGMSGTLGAYHFELGCNGGIKHG